MYATLTKQELMDIKSALLAVNSPVSNAHALDIVGKAIARLEADENSLMREDTMSEAYQVLDLNSIDVIA